MYTSFFPELKIRRVDVEDNLFRVYCSIKTTTESEVPLWIEDEEFSNFISFFFFIWIEEIPENFTGRRYSEVFFGDKVDSFYRLFDLDPGFDQLTVDRENRSILKIEHKITMEEVKQQSLGFVEGVSITPEYGTTETLFQVEIPIPSSEFFFESGQLSVEVSPGATMTTNMIAYSHLDVDEFVSNYNITTGLDEIKRLGGNAVYLELINQKLGDITVSENSVNIVSYSGRFGSADPFIGFYDNDLFSTNRSPDIAPGLPDALSWKHNTNVQSILRNAGNVFHEATKSRKIKEASINSVKDGNSCKLSENCWITLTESDRHYNYHFILDMYSIIKNHSALGYLLDSYSSKSKLTGGPKRAFINSVVRSSKIKSMKVSRIRVENIPNTTNRAGNLIYENVQATEDDPCVYSSDFVSLDGETRLIPADSYDELSNRRRMSLRELDTNLANRKALIPKLARTFLVTDEHFFEHVTDGNYKYFIDLKIEDGFVREIGNIISNLKNAINTVKLLLARVELAGFSDEKQRNFSEFADNYDEEELKSSINIYANNLAVLNLVPGDATTGTDKLKEELLRIVSPKKLGNYENVRTFYNNLINLELQFLQILSGVGLPNNFDSILENSFSKNKQKSPSSNKNNLISISIESEKTVKSFNKNAIFIDFSNLNLLSTRPGEIFILPERYLTFSNRSLNNPPLTDVFNENDY